MQKINFQNLPNTTTPVNASNLNAIQTNAENEFNKLFNKNDASLLTDATRIPITPLAGSNYSGYGNSFYYKIGSRVHVHLGLQGLTPNTNQTVFSPPTGYKPVTSIGSAGVGGSMSEVVTVQVGSSISVRSPSEYALIDVDYDAFE